jgi:hypothetical protein
MSRPLCFLHNRTRQCGCRPQQHGAELGEVSSPTSHIHPGETPSTTGAIEGEGQKARALIRMKCLCG